MKNLTVQQAGDLLVKAVQYKLGHGVKVVKGGYHDAEYEMMIDKGFCVTMKTEGIRIVEEMNVILKDDQFEFRPFSFNHYLQGKAEETPIKWIQEGPWVMILEKKLKEIQESYDFFVKQEQQQKKNLSDYFKQLFPEEIKEYEKDLSFYHLKRELFKLGNSPHSGVKVSQQKSYGFNGGGTYEFDHFSIVIDQMTMSVDAIKIELRDQYKTYVLYDEIVKEEPTIILEEDYWKHVLIDCMEKAKKKVEDAVRQQYQHEILHFTKKYRLKSF